MILKCDTNYKRDTITELCPFVYLIENNLSDDFCDKLISLYDLPSLKSSIIQKEKLPVNLINLEITKPGEDFVKDYADIYLTDLIRDADTSLRNSPDFQLLKDLDTALFKSLVVGLRELHDFLDDKCFIMSKILKRVKGLDDAPIISFNETGDRFELNFAEDLGYQLQKSGKEYKGFVLHDDYSPERTLTYQWYLNDDFEGGETVFTYPGYHVKPKKGSLLLFPALWTHSHIGLAPKNAYKYIATGWMKTNFMNTDYS